MQGFPGRILSEYSQINEILSFDGSVGYGIGGGRVELEVGYEKFKTKGVKRGDADDEGIYLLAKDLAYNVALDQTSQLTEGIQKLTNKEMKIVSDGIHVLDKDLNSSTDNQNSMGKWKCTNGSSNTEPTDAAPCKWHATHNTGGRSLKVGFDKVVASIAKKVDGEVAKNVSERMTSPDFTRDEKGKIASAFAKAHEGAEIVVIT